jgi:hypothetical protein
MAPRKAAPAAPRKRAPARPHITKDAQTFVERFERARVKSVENARADYAEWFVKLHYLRKKDRYSASLNTWRHSEDRGFIRFYKKTWPADAKRKQEVHYHDEDDNTLLVASTSGAEISWWRIAIDKLDNEDLDNHPIALRYRRYRELAEKELAMRWLLAEAEWHVVTNEAWLRTYGVEVEATCQS